MLVGASRLISELQNYPLPVPFFEGLQINADLSKSVYFPLLKYGCYPHQVTEDLITSTFLADGDVVVDIGASIGWVSLLCASCVGQEGAVYAIEPSAKSYEDLERVAKAIKIIRPLRAAISDVSGVQHFTDESLLDRSHLSAPGDKKTYPVEVLTLDSWVQEAKLTRLDFVKIDTEGNDLKALAGARDALQRWEPIVECELLDEAAVVELQDTLPPGYVIYACYSTYPLGGRTGPRKTSNYFAVPKTKLGLIPEFLFRRGSLKQVSFPK
jgi:FkbM family methyltransferase